MKKMFFLVMMSFAILSCEKTDVKPSNYVGENGEYERPEQPPNYCAGCGTSDNPADYCNQEGCVTGLPDCPETEINSISNENELGFLLSDDECYLIRDNLLATSTKLSYYITYYYRLGELGLENDDINIETVVDYYNFANMVIDAAQLLMEGDDSVIIITQDFKQIAMGYISHYRTLTTDDELLSYLDEIEMDLDGFEGLTRAEVLELI